VFGCQLLGFDLRSYSLEVAQSKTGSKLVLGEIMFFSCEALGTDGKRYSYMVTPLLCLTALL
jgi:hypothetical protein